VRRSHSSLIVVAALALAACTPTPDPTLPIKPDPCPPSAAAAVEADADRVGLTEDQQLKLDIAGIGALGDLYVRYILGESQHGARAARLENRVEQTREWCSARD